MNANCRFCVGVKFLNFCFASSALRYYTILHFFSEEIKSCVLCFVAVLLFLTGLIAACGLAASHNLLKHSCGGILLCSRLVVGDFLPRYDE